jgi:hypothetical protein
MTGTTSQAGNVYHSGAPVLPPVVVSSWRDVLDTTLYDKVCQ